VLAEKQIAMAQQRQSLADAYMLSISDDSTSETVESDLQVARSSLAARTYDSALRLATHSLVTADAEMAAARAGRLALGQWTRAPLIVAAAIPLLDVLGCVLALLAAALPLARALGLIPWSLLKTWKTHTVIGVVAGALAWRANWWLGRTEPAWPLLPDVLIASASLCLILVAAIDLRIRLGWVRRGITDPAGTGIAVAISLCALALTFEYLTALTPAWIFYQQGLTVTWYLPDPSLLAQMREGVAQLYTVSLLLAPLPWIGTALYGFSRAFTAWWWERE
jgi:hypothetical protein